MGRRAVSPGLPEPVPTEDGSPTLFSEEYGEHFHNLSGAALEARERYLVPCRIVELARARGRLSILDIGFGLGFNVALACEALREGAPEARVRITTLEKSPIPPALWRKLARGLLGGGARSRGEEEITEGLATLLTAGEARLGPVEIKMRVGAAEDVIEDLEGPFDAVFLDPFSPDRNPELWTERFLGEVARKCRAGAILSTYSAAVRPRVALLRAGWRIGAGPRVGRKSSGTLATIGEVEPPIPPLTPREQRRLQRRAEEVREP